MNGERYDCQYEVKENGIEVEIDYDIEEEIPAVNGIRTIGPGTNYKERNLLIIDSKAKMNYLLILARFSGKTSMYGPPDGYERTRFFSSNYFYDKDYISLGNLSEKTEIYKIRIYSKLIGEFVGILSAQFEDSKDEYVIRLNRNEEKIKVDIEKNNIKSLIISDDWIAKTKNSKSNININISEYIEIELDKAVKYSDIYNYVKEIMIYFQLLKPEKFKIDEIKVETNSRYFGFSMPFEKIEIKENYVGCSLNVKLVEYLKNCYEKIPFRNSKNEIRNIPYIVLRTSRGLEDNFLMFYRFIECYYKKQNIKGIKNTFIEYSIKNNYKGFNKIGEEKLEDFSREIISLRNRYAHEGYYIKDNKLYVTYPKIGKKANPKNHRIYNADTDWIYEKTKVLYEIAIDIIFRDMLGYDKYEFKKHF